MAFDLNLEGFQLIEKNRQDIERKKFSLTQFFIMNWLNKTLIVYKQIVQGIYLHVNTQISLSLIYRKYQLKSNLPLVYFSFPFGSSLCLRIQLVSFLPQNILEKLQPRIKGPGSRLSIECGKIKFASYRSSSHHRIILQSLLCFLFSSPGLNSCHSFLNSAVFFWTPFS